MAVACARYLTESDIQCPGGIEETEDIYIYIYIVCALFGDWAAPDTAYAIINSCHMFTILEKVFFWVWKLEENIYY